MKFSVPRSMLSECTPGTADVSAKEYAQVLSEQLQRVWRRRVEVPAHHANDFTAEASSAAMCCDFVLATVFTLQTQSAC